MNKNAALASFLQLGEYLIVGIFALGVLYFAQQYLGLDVKVQAGDFLKILLAALLGSGAKYSRANPGNGIPDYVNAPLKEGEEDNS